MPRLNEIDQKKRVGPNGYRLPFNIRDGEIFTDLNQKRWRLGKSIGYGGFGEIYLASDEISKPVLSDAKYVIKVEPHSNGPLLIERIFYMRVAKIENIDSWVAKNEMNALGMPYFVGAGSHFYKGEHYRFLIIPRFGLDLQRVFLQHKKKFHIKTALTLASYIIDILEYLHSYNYVHADIKPDNLLLGLAAQAPIYLVDFGLACRYRYPNGRHKEYCLDERRAHYGTIEYTSRDAHLGAISRRGDLEILGYNIVYWLTGHLPWENDLSDEEIVAEKKRYAMNNVIEFLSSCFKPNQPPGILVDYLDYLNKLDFDSQPNYKYCKRLFRKGIQDAGFCDDGKLTFEKHSKLKAKKRKYSETENIGVKKIRKSSTFRSQCDVLTNRKPCTAQNYNRMTRNTSSTQSNEVQPLENFNWAMVLAGHPEKSVKKNMQSCNKINQPSRCDIEISKFCDNSYDDSLENPTPAMLEVIARMEQRTKETAQTITSHRRSKSGSRCSSPTEFCTSSVNTPAMEAVIKKQQAAAAAAAAAAASASASSSMRTTRSSSRKSPAPERELRIQFKATVLNPQPSVVSKRPSSSLHKRSTRLNCVNG